MIKLVNLSYRDYLRKYGNKKIIGIGAGGTLQRFLFNHVEMVGLLDKIEILLDNNKEIAGKKVNILKKSIEIQYLPDFKFEDDSDNWVVFLFLLNDFVMDVVRQLDSNPIWDGMICILGSDTLRWGQSYFPEPRIDNVIMWKERKEKRIPKIIHYCWFGPTEIPKKDKLCIESFSKYNPDYKIIKWSEDNFNMEEAPSYVKEAYKNKRYAFVTDYVRLWAVYTYGGIYLDTDVELFGSLDFILGFRMMFAYMEYGEIATGLGFASVKGTPELKNLMNLYEKIPFENLDGSLNLTPCPRYTNDYFRRMGIYPSNSLEIIDDILFLPSDFLCGMAPVLADDGGFYLASLCVSDNTVGIHWGNNSWKDEKDYKIFIAEKEKREEINDRLLNDWKRDKFL